MKPRLEYFSYRPCVQTKLNALMPDALPPLKVDGTYGDSTVAPVKQFQKSRGLFPDGLVGAKTWAAIDGLPGPSPGQSPHSVPSSPPVETHGSHAELRKANHHGAELQGICATSSSP
jgi:peptidoglycan hydrolase-like protein with peptidoglycan-binding domain